MSTTTCLTRSMLICSRQERSERKIDESWSQPANILVKMRPEHREIQEWIKKRYSARFDVCAEVDKTNCLRVKRYRYQPDVVLKSLNDPNDIRYIIEVENDPVRKAIVGACLLADCSIQERRGKPAGLIFIIYSENGKRQIKNFKGRVEDIRHRCPHLSSIEVVTYEDFKQGKGFEIRSTCKRKSLDKKLQAASGS